MLFEGSPVPANLVQIVNITQKDGSPLEPDNWRLKRIGLVTMCWIAGGFNRLTPYFKGKIFMEDGEVKGIDLFWNGNASTGRKFPTEVEPGIFDFETNTSIYRFRVLTEEEEQKVSAALEEAVKKEFQERFRLMAEPPAGGTGGFPAS